MPEKDKKYWPKWGPLGDVLEHKIKRYAEDLEESGLKDVRPDLAEGIRKILYGFDRILKRTEECDLFVIGDVVRLQREICKFKSLPGYTKEEIPLYRKGIDIKMLSKEEIDFVLDSASDHLDVTIVNYFRDKCICKFKPRPEQ